MKKIAKITSVLLFVVSILHLLRVINNWDVVVDSYQVPMWISYLGVIIPLILSIGLWKESNK